MARLRRNVCEAKFEQLASGKGWKPSKRGWPDFICFGPDGDVIAVEVKPRTRQGHLKFLKREQAAVLDVLSAAGIRCFVSDGETLETYDRSIHAKQEKRTSGTRTVARAFPLV